MNVDGFQQVKNKKCTRRNIFDEVNDDLQHLAKEQRKATTFQDLRRSNVEFHNGRRDLQGGENSKDEREVHASIGGLATFIETHEHLGRKASSAPHTTPIEPTTSKHRSEPTTSELATTVRGEGRGDPTLIRMWSPERNCGSKRMLPKHTWTNANSEHSVEGDSENEEAAKDGTKGAGIHNDNKRVAEEQLMLHGTTMLAM